MPDPEFVETERVRRDPTKKPPYEERMMNVLSAIHGQLARIADGVERLADNIESGGAPDPMTMLTARLGEMLGGKKKKGRR